jgi:hypothetical protein
MTLQLNDDDSRAVDFLLGRQTGEGREVAMLATEGFAARIGTAGRVLDLLRLLPEPEVPSDLVARTMARIQSACCAEVVEQEEQIAAREPV